MSGEEEIRQEKIEKAKRDIERGVDKNPEVIDEVVKRILPKIFPTTILCFHCEGKKFCNCSLCSSSPDKTKPCFVCYGMGVLNKEGRPLIGFNEFFKKWRNS